MLFLTGCQSKKDCAHSRKVNMYFFPDEEEPAEKDNPSTKGKIRLCSTFNSCPFKTFIPTSNMQLKTPDGKDSPDIGKPIDIDILQEKKKIEKKREVQFFKCNKCGMEVASTDPIYLTKCQRGELEGVPCDGRYAFDEEKHQKQIKDRQEAEKKAEDKK